MAVKIKLKRLGKIRAPYYRIVVADARTKRDGRAIEEIGKYHPKAEPSFIEVNSERAQHWLKVGAQPTDPVRKILEITGDWQKFKGLPGTEGTLKVAEPKADKKVAFATAVAESLTESGAKPKARGKAGDARAEKPARADARAEKPARADAKAEKPAKAEAKADKPEAKSDKAEKPARPARAKKAEEAAAEPAEAPAAEAPAAKEAEAPAAKEAAAEAASDAPAGETPAGDAPAADVPAGDTAAGAAESAGSEA